MAPGSASTGGDPFLSLIAFPEDKEGECKSSLAFQNGNQLY